jgi:pimeloyl-ACP methyl ester carboxylesterase
LAIPLALCTLEAALIAGNVRRLVLYEPPLPLEGVPIYPPGVIDHLQSLLDGGDREGVVATFMAEVVRMPPHELDLFKTLPAWSERVAAAHTLPRELRVHEQYVFVPGRFEGVPIPTLLLLGGDSPAFFKAAVEAIDAVLPDSQIVPLPGQQHIAIDTAPELFAREVLDFLSPG